MGVVALLVMCPGLFEQTMRNLLLHFVFMYFCLLMSLPLTLSFINNHVNPFKPNGISFSYQLIRSIFVLRVVGWYFSYLFKLYKKVL